MGTRSTLNRTARARVPLLAGYRRGARIVIGQHFPHLLDHRGAPGALTGISRHSLLGLFVVGEHGVVLQRTGS